MEGSVVAVSRSESHSFSKPNQESIQLIAGYGVEGDAHAGATVQHLSRMAKNPDTPNVRQVHLLHAEVFEEVHAAGFEVGPGQIGENVTTRGIDILALPTGTRLRLGKDAVVEVTGLRNPCAQIDDFQSGLMAAFLGKDEQGNLVRKSGVMGIVVTGGEVRPGDPIQVEFPSEPHRPLEKV